MPQSITLTMEDRMRWALGLGALTVNIDDQYIVEPTPPEQVPHHKDVEMALLRGVLALDKIAREHGYITSADHRVHPMSQHARGYACPDTNMSRAKHYPAGVATPVQG